VASKTRKARVKQGKGTEDKRILKLSSRKQHMAQALSGKQAQDGISNGRQKNNGSAGISA